MPLERDARDPLALEKDLDGARRQPNLDLAAGEAVGDAVEVRLDSTW